MWRVIANYKLFERSSATQSKKLITQQFCIGGGVKLATNKFNADPADGALVALANKQTGSASTDYLLNAQYNISINKFGVSAGARYKINTANTDQYYLGTNFPLIVLWTVPLVKKQPLRPVQVFCTNLLMPTNCKTQRLTKQAATCSVLQQEWR